ETLKDPDEKVRTYAHAALVGLHRDAVPAVVALLKDKDKTLRVEAGRILYEMGAMGRRCPEAIPPLAVALKDRDKDVRLVAAEALRWLVVRVLTDPHWDEERRKGLVAALVDNLRDPDEQVSQSAQGVLVSLNRDAVPALAELVQGKDKRLRVKAATVLGQMG